MDKGAKKIDMRALYRSLYPANGSSQGASQLAAKGEAPAVQFEEDGEGLRRLAPPLMESLVGLSPADKLRRKVSLPRGRSPKDICSLAAAVVASDAQFGLMDRDSLLQCDRLGDVLREARLAGVPLVELEVDDLQQIKEAVLRIKGWAQVEPTYEMKQILMDKVVEGEVFYMVEWVSPPGEVTWELQANLEGTAQALLDQYRTAKQVRKGTPKRGARVSLQELQAVRRGPWADMQTAQPELQPGVQQGVLAEAWAAPHMARSALERGDEADAQDAQQVAQTPVQSLVGVLEEALPALMASMSRLATEVSDVKSWAVKVRKSSATSRKRVRMESSDEEQEEEDTRLPRDRPVLKGDKRLAQVGWSHYARECELYRKYAAMKMGPNVHLAAQYNAKLDDMLEVEEQMMECELKVLKAEAAAKAKPDNEDLGEKWRDAQATHNVYKQQFAVLNDEVNMLGECSREAAAGRGAVALKVMEMAKRSSKETSARKEWRKLVKSAEAELKEEREQDKELWLCHQLGANSASWRSQEARGGLQQYMGNQLRPLPPASGGTHDVLAIMPPPPPPVRPLPAGTQQAMAQGLKGLGESRASQARRCVFKPAEEVLHRDCPPELQGTMLPQGMKFFTPGKQLDSPVKDRKGNEFAHMCKVCGMAPPQVKGHEAFECLEKFTVEGKPGRTYRELFQMGWVDKTGTYK